MKTKIEVQRTGKARKKEEANPVTEAKKSLSSLPKIQKQKNRNTKLKTKTCITKDFTEINIESTSVASVTKNDSLKLIVLSMIKGLPNSKNICWFNSVMVTVMNIIGSNKALDLPKRRLVLFWKKFDQLTSYLSFWGDKNDSTKNEHLSMVEKYFQLTSMFHIGREEDATEFFL